MSCAFRKKFVTILALTLMGLGALPPRAIADPANSCDVALFALNPLVNAEAVLNARLSTRFPRLAVLLKDPDEFFANMSRRFDEQKLTDPAHPYAFDYSEVGIPMMEDMKSSIERKLAKLQNQRADANLSPQKSRDLEIASYYLNDLLHEAKAALDAGKVSYIETVEFSYFYARAIGHFNPDGYSFFARNFLKIDRGLEGYKQLSIDDEYALYKSRKFELIPKHRRSTSSGFRVTEKEYEDAFSSKDRLRLLIVPTNENLDHDVLMRLMSRENISLVGVTEEPVLADGFLRPAGDFWVHDIRHESAKYYGKMRYVEQHHLSSNEVHALDLRMDLWYLDLERAIAEVGDPELRETLDLLTFNFYHDRGYQIVPSTYLESKKDSTFIGLYTAMKISGQGVKFSRPIRNYNRADRWLRAFWGAKLSEESDFLAGLGHD